MSRIFAIILGLITGCLHAQESTGVTGYWITRDDESGIDKSIVYLWIEDGTLYGRVAQILHLEPHQNGLCVHCPEEFRNQPVEGMRILWDMKHDPDDAEWNSGRILDPVSGNLYRAKLWLEKPNELKLRGYIGISLFGRTEIWRRLEDRSRLEKKRKTLRNRHST